MLLHEQAGASTVGDAEGAGTTTGSSPSRPRAATGLLLSQSTLAAAPAARTGSSRMSPLACTGCRNLNESVRQDAAPSTDAQNDTRGATRSRREYGSHAQDEVDLRGGALQGRRPTGSESGCASVLLTSSCIRPGLSLSAQWRSARGPYYLGVDTMSDSLSLIRASHLNWSSARPRGQEKTRITYLTGLPTSGKNISSGPRAAAL